MALERTKRAVLRLSPPFLRDPLVRSWRWARRNWISLDPDSVERAEIHAALLDVGVMAGDTLMVHSSLSSFGHVQGGADTVLGALMDAVGPEGTLVFPTFSIPGSMLERISDPSYVFDPASTPSRMGAISEAFRKLPGVQRNHHPTHSLAVWGRHQERLLRDEDLAFPTNFGPGTTMGRLAEVGAKVVGLGISLGPVTYYHCFEDHHLERFPGVYLPERVPVRILTAKGRIDSTILVHAPGYHARRVDKDPRIEAAVRAFFDARGVRPNVPLGRSGVWAVRCVDFLRMVDEMHQQGMTIYSAPTAAQAT